MRDNVDFDVEKMFGKPLKLKKDKGRGSKPDRGLVPIIFCLRGVAFY
jgi:hypothetical protein